MCDVKGACPLCGTRLTDKQETACSVTNGIATRTYHCRGCTATVWVKGPDPVVLPRCRSWKDYYHPGLPTRRVCRLDAGHQGPHKNGNRRWQ